METGAIRRRNNVTVSDFEIRDGGISVNRNQKIRSPQVGSTFFFDCFEHVVRREAYSFAAPNENETRPCLRHSELARIHHPPSNIVFDRQGPQQSFCIVSRSALARSLKSHRNAANVFKKNKVWLDKRYQPQIFAHQLVARIIDFASAGT